MRCYQASRLPPAKAVNFGTGTIVRVWPDQGIYVESGGTLLNWASATFTSFRDNGRGGDVGAGPWATPQPGDWDGNLGREHGTSISLATIFTMQPISEN